MKTIHLTTFINAPREKVWKTMLEDATYREWTAAFNPGSYYEGKWETGSKMRFLGPAKDGQVGGMASRIKESRPYEYVSIEHLGVVVDGKEIIGSEEFKGWAGAMENYTFNEKDGGTELIVDCDTDDSEFENMEAMWKKALVKLKELAEK